MCHGENILFQLRRFGKMGKALLATDDSPASLIIRLALGIVMFPHGAQKVFGWFGGLGFAQTIQAFQGMGFPAWSTIILMIIECLGSLLLIAGALTRLWALGIGSAIATCMVKYHLQNGFFMNWFGQQKGEGFEYHLLVIGIALALLIRGGGKWSVDRALTRGNDGAL
jgi:putative oxidoreductase